jgi:hypothetical protein
MTNTKSIREAFAGLATGEMGYRRTSIINTIELLAESRPRVSLAAISKELKLFHTELEDERKKLTERNREIDCLINHLGFGCDYDDELPF